MNEFKVGTKSALICPKESLTGRSLAGSNVDRNVDSACKANCVSESLSIRPYHLDFYYVYNGFKIYLCYFSSSQ